MFVKDLYRDEIRAGFVVKSDAKKVWSRYLEIWQALDKLCRRHGITYWAGDETLVGALRHGGFVPWLEEFSLWMFRPDYNRFLTVLDELPEPFALNHAGFTSTKIAHTQTTLIDFATFDADKVLGLTIDVCALDVARDGTRESFIAFNALNELYAASVNFAAIARHLRGGGKTINDLDVLEKISADREADKLQTLKLYAEALFGQSLSVAKLDEIINAVGKPLSKDWFRETICLPFETVEIPVPVDSEKILAERYGRNFLGRDELRFAGDLYSAEIPYEEILRIIARHGGLEKTLREGYLIQLYDLDKK